jgi:hypothetical protein
MATILQSQGRADYLLLYVTEQEIHLNKFVTPLAAYLSLLSLTVSGKPGAVHPVGWRSRLRAAPNLRTDPAHTLYTNQPLVGVSRAGESGYRPALVPGHFLPILSQQLKRCLWVNAGRT